MIPVTAPAPLPQIAPDLAGRYRDLILLEATPMATRAPCGARDRQRGRGRGLLAGPRRSRR